MLFDLDSIQWHGVSHDGVLSVVTCQQIAGSHNHSLGGKGRSILIHVIGSTAFICNIVIFPEGRRWQTAKL